MKLFMTTLVLILALFNIALPSMAAAPPGESQQTSVEPVNINNASAEQLAAVLDGIGIAKAEAIVEYRKAKGPFRSVASLAAVKGVGESTVSRNRSRIRLK